MMGLTAGTIFIEGCDEGPTKVYRFEESTKVGDVLQAYGSDHELGAQLVCSGRVLSPDEPLALQGVTPLSTLWLLPITRGGLPPQYRQACQQTVREKQLKPLPGFVELTQEADCISLDDDPDTTRAKMPCGHVLGVDSMTQYARSVVFNDKQFRFFCPGFKPDGSPCRVDWDYSLVRHVALFTQDERREIESELGKLYLIRGRQMRACPGCGFYCFREDSKVNRMVCPVCTGRQGGRRPYEFCWACLNPWKAGGRGVKACGNDTCSGLDPRLRYLKEAPKKTVGSVPGVPSLRACPRCGAVIHHQAGCKHMECHFCKTDFCFVCLAVPDRGGNWPCGSWNSPCRPAAVQKKLPGQDN